jgi:hypothetical protein
VSQQSFRRRYPLIHLVTRTRGNKGSGLPAAAVRGLTTSLVDLSVPKALEESVDDIVNQLNLLEHIVSGYRPVVLLTNENYAFG